ncbi:hypothetical protein [Janthinobacterium sp.]|uniref:hypothetical protein n=1 Tax=Janthinobacterium sp. TaxID=1871054 RepID=UPI0025BC72A6|nr:hypothetical protein [Janthinobacterium sp.]
MLACRRQARCRSRAVAAAIKHAGILAQDGAPHRRGAGGSGMATVQRPAAARPRHTLANCRMMIQEAEKSSLKTLENLMIYPIKSTIYTQVLRILRHIF